MLFLLINILFVVTSFPHVNNIFGANRELMTFDTCGSTTNGICSNDKTKACSSSNNCNGATCYLPTNGGVTLCNQICMQTAAGQGLQCTANDVNIASVTSLSVVNGCSKSGDDATISFVAKFVLTAQDRYDIGVWIAQDGGNALTGTCSVSNFPSSPSPPWTNLDSSTDTCGDITSSNNPLYSSIKNIKVKCIDLNNDGNLDVNVCLSWQQPGSNALCTSPLQAFPGSPSKCVCQKLPSIKIDVPPVIIIKKITDISTNIDFNFILKKKDGSKISQTPFTLKNGGIYTHTECDISTSEDSYYYIVELPTPNWNLYSATCASNSVVYTQITPDKMYMHNGEVITCIFTNKYQSTNQPTVQPTRQPVTDQPTVQPTRQPVTDQPTGQPTHQPVTDKPTVQPTRQPVTNQPTGQPTRQPITDQPTGQPSFASHTSTGAPTKPTCHPTKSPTRKSTKVPTEKPTRKPTKEPTLKPTKLPSKLPTTKAPVNRPTSRPTTIKPSKAPTRFPTRKPTKFPSAAPTRRNTTDGFIDKICPTCKLVIANTATRTIDVVYSTNGNLISAVNPLVLYYDSMIFSPSTTFRANVVQIITNGKPNWIPMPIQNSYFIVQRTPNCERVSSVTLTNEVLSVTRVVANSMYVLQVKYNVTSLIGKTAPDNNVIPTYAFQMFINNVFSSVATIRLVHA